MDDLASKFEDAQKRVKALSKAPSNEDLLELYALYKQGTSGDVSGSRPGMMDFKGRAHSLGLPSESKTMFTWLARSGGGAVSPRRAAPDREASRANLCFLIHLASQVNCDAWAGKKGVAKDAAMTKYIALVDRLAK